MQENPFKTLQISLSFISLASLWTKFDFERGIFQIILACTQDNLHPFYTSSFVKELAVKGFIYSC